MAAPNIVNVTTIIGRTAIANVSTTATNMVTNAADSNKVFKVNTLVISNIDGTNTADITASIFRGSVEYRIAPAVTVPTKSSLVVLSKDMQIYLEENDSLRITASANSRLQAVCSYEDIG